MRIDETTFLKVTLLNHLFIPASILEFYTVIGCSYLSVLETLQKFIKGPF